MAEEGAVEEIASVLARPLSPRTISSLFARLQSAVLAIDQLDLLDSIALLRDLVPTAHQRATRKKRNQSVLSLK